jgi:hypothetical protein
MSRRIGIQGHDGGAGSYEIRVEGHLDKRWAASFEGMILNRETDGTTTLRGPLPDQAALHGLLARVRDVGLSLVSVTRIEPDRPARPAS